MHIRRIEDMMIDEIICGDAIETLKKMPPNCVDLIFADPPFNAGKAYQDKRGNYYQWCREWIGLCFRVLKPTGSFYLMTISKHLRHKFDAMGMHGIFIDQIVWTTSSPLSGERRFALNYQPILLYGKTDQYTFNPKVQLVKKSLVVTAKVAKAKPELTEGYMGRVGNVWDDIGYINGGCMARKEAVLQKDSKKKVHPCQMPIALAERAILFSTDEGDVVLDPFIGSGSAAVAAIRTSRHYIGIELEQKFVDLTEERIRIERSQLNLDLGR